LQQNLEDKGYDKNEEKEEGRGKEKERENELRMNLDCKYLLILHK
jgi:hypothetical protein